MRDRLFSALSVPDEIDLTALEKITFFSNREKMTWQMAALSLSRAPLQSRRSGPGQGWVSGEGRRRSALFLFLYLKKIKFQKYMSNKI